MTPSARLSAAIEALDVILTGEPAERVLTRWSRGARFAGSKDRAAVRDIVFDCLRMQRSLAHRAGGLSGRGLVAAHQAAAGEDLAALFSGERFAPEPLGDEERSRLAAGAPAPGLPVALDFPDFLEDELRRSLGDGLEPVMAAMQSRAPVDLRVNTLKASRDEAQAALADEGIETSCLALAATALRVEKGARQIAQSEAFRSGLVELQDAASQAVALFCAAEAGERVLDYCAGGGGKTLALGAAMKGKGEIVAHDIAPARMKDLPERADRAGLPVRISSPSQLGAERFDLVFADAPCSGTGAWRRNPDAKWKLTPEDLRDIRDIQDDVLARASLFVGPEGRLAYATCSLLRCENQDRVATFLERNAGWRLCEEMVLTPLDGGDGFYLAVLRREGKHL